MIATMKLNPERMRRAALESYVLATDMADYLVGKGVPFREAHGIMKELSSYALEQGKYLHDLTMEEYKRFSPHFEEDVLGISVESSIAARDVPGGTAPGRVEIALKAARKQLEGSLEG
jgi:argininosuccinate lyase